LHKGRDPGELKERFADLLRSVSPEQIAMVEQTLIEEGLPRDQVMRLCDVHMSLFQEALDRDKPLAPAGHPITILMAEHQALLDIADRLNQACKAGITDQIPTLVSQIKDSANHYLREENVLFPHLERHGITEPPAIMWAERDKIRATEKELCSLLGQPGADPTGVSSALYQLLSSHFYKENNVLFPMAMKVIGNEQWPSIRQEFDQVGYCGFTPRHILIPIRQEPAHAPSKNVTGQFEFDTGSLSLVELQGILDNLPFDITFVDKDDSVRYFNQSKDRIFLRTKAVLGRKVQQCHPQKSIHIVNQILDEFRSGKRNVAEFWINLKGRLIYIRYVPVKDSAGQYLGCLEVTQDITHLKDLSREKRLL
jgi:PAS domain S-box-containing protein